MNKYIYINYNIYMIFIYFITNLTYIIIKYTIFLRYYFIKFYKFCINWDNLYKHFLFFILAFKAGILNNPGIK